MVTDVLAKCAAAYSNFRVQLNDLKTFGCLSFWRKSESDGLASFLSRWGRLFIRPGDSDLETLRQVLVRREYDISKFAQFQSLHLRYQEALSSGIVPLIVDCGANIGAASLFFAKMFPEARIIAVEPSPNSVDVLRRNIAGLTNVDVLLAGIASSQGLASLDAAAGQSWGYRTVVGSGSIRLITIPEIVNAQQPNIDLLLVKIDIEGAEADLFHTNTDWLEHVGCVIVEPHDWMLPWTHSSDSFRRALDERFDLLILAEHLVFFRRNFTPSIAVTSERQIG